MGGGQPEGEREISGRRGREELSGPDGWVDFVA